MVFIFHRYYFVYKDGHFLHAQIGFDLIFGVLTPLSAVFPALIGNCNMNALFSFYLFIVYIYLSACKQQSKDYEIIHSTPRYRVLHTLDMDC